MDKLELNWNGKMVDAVLGHWVAAILVSMPDAQRRRVFEELEKITKGAIPVKQTNGVLHA